MLCVLNDEVLEKNDLSKRCDNYCLSSTWPLSEFDRHSFKVKDKIMLFFITKDEGQVLFLFSALVK